MDKMSKLGQEILDGLHETSNFLNGKDTEGNAVMLYNGQRISITEIRKKLGMTREEFAQAFHFKTRTVQNWERGFRHPNDHTLAYLQVIASDPKGVYNTLHS